MTNVKQSELWIGGEHVPSSSGRYFDDLNPDDDSLYARVAEATAADMDRAVRVADAAFQVNQRWLAADRERWLIKAAELVERDREEYIDILVDEVGSPLFKAQFEVGYCISALRAAAGVPRMLRGEVIPSDVDTSIGPIISPRQRERVKHHIEDARAKGAEVLCGGEWVGNRCQPTILRNVEEGMVVCREETFGPVTSLYVFDDVDEAMRRANDTEYGLSFSIFTRSLDAALRLSRQARSGMVHINRPTIQDEPHVPFGGRGMSGFGREGTRYELDVLTDWKWITISAL